MGKAGVIFKVQFNQSGTWNSDYYHYVDDNKKSIKEASKIEKTLNYIDYIDSKFEKHKKRKYVSKSDGELKQLDNTSLSFARTASNFNNKEINNMLRKYNEACENKSNLWKGVISFDHEFLKEYKILTEKNNILYVNDSLLKEYAKQSIEAFILESNLVEADYHAGIHYNTDNIHIHFAVFEKYGSTKKGVVKQSVLDSVKSKMINNISRDINFYKEIDLLKRNIKLDLKSKYGSYDYKVRKLCDILPEKGRMSYGTLESDSKLKIEVDIIINKLLDSSPSYQKFNEELNKGVTKYSTLYGGDGVKFEKYKENKINTLKNELGNMVLKDIKNAKNNKNDSKIYSSAKKTKRIVNYSNKNTLSLIPDLKRLKQSLDKKKSLDIQQSQIEDEYSIEI